MPTAATSQTTAAVVSPRTASRRTKIRPAPMNPTPDTIWAATRDGSRVICPGTITSLKPYLLISMIRADATPTRVWVRSPAAFCRSSRSSPISADSAKAVPSSPNWTHPCPPEIPSGLTLSRPAADQSMMTLPYAEPSRYPSSTVSAE